jgi:ribosomal protein L37AE/L43A
MERNRAAVLERKEQQRRFNRALEVAQRDHAITGSMTLKSDAPCSSCGQQLTGERAPVGVAFCWSCRQKVPL